MLKKLLVVGLLIFSGQVFGADKVITCPWLVPLDDSGTEGRTEGGAWRIDTFFFNTDDFSREGDRFALFKRQMHYFNPTWKKEKDRVQQLEFNRRVTYTTTPTSILFHTQSVPSVFRSHEISRTSLVLLSENYTTIQCSISDLQIERTF